MIDKVKVMLRDGSMVDLPVWQKQYGLKEYSNSIGKYFSISEHRFDADIDMFGQLVVNELLMRVLDGYREATNEPCCINSFNRDQAKQDQLQLAGYRTATHSPHIVKLAADVDTPGVDDLRKMKKHAKQSDFELWKEAVRINWERASMMRQVASILGIKVRIGHKEYLEKRQTFIHVDVCPEYFAAGKPFHKTPHPKVWERETTW